MLFRWIIFIAILIRFVVWCRKDFNFKDLKSFPEKLGAVLGIATSVVTYLGALWYILLSQFI